MKIRSFLAWLPLLCALQATAQQVTPANALSSYLSNGDKTFGWEVKDTFRLGDVTAYNILLTSQRWREYTWKHQLTVFVPAKISHDEALLYIGGGSLKDSLPRWNTNGPKDRLHMSMAKIAGDRQAVTAIIRQTPNQPLYNGLNEDALISFTLHNFKKDQDYSWPLLFPMVKSAVRAMDAVQEFARQAAHKELRSFVVTGASKRGWTTWLTGANDKRVIGIAPMVIDILNMPVSLQYQISTWNEYSPQIKDYVKLGIPQSAQTPEGESLNRMIDPYAYRSTLSMPKMLFMATNDPYWVVDNVKNYINDIPGRYFLHYIPNEGHNMGDGTEVVDALGAFFGQTINNYKYPEFKYTTTTSGKGVEVKTAATRKQLVDVIVWSATSPDLDFRNDRWTSRSLGISGTSSVTVQQPFPAKGYGAFYVDLKYKDTNGGEYTVSTRVFLTDTGKVL
ncbi:PhoPQ-activated pathogenicity-related family protein [Chitinophaga lutea]